LLILFSFNECGGAFAVSAFNAPIILVSPVSAPPYTTTLYGNPSPPSFIPFLFLGYPQNMTFYQRVVNFITEGFIRHTAYNVAFPEIATKYRKILNDESLPSVEGILRRTSLILSNSHFSISHTRPFLPDIVEVGGMHCYPAQPLPEASQKLIEFGVNYRCNFKMTLTYVKC
jgi:glucuronosyltransferase